MATACVVCTVPFKTPLKTLNLSIFKPVSLAHNSDSNFFIRIKGFCSRKNRLFCERFALSKNFGFCVSCKSVAAVSVDKRDFEFSDGAAEVELRLHLGGPEFRNSKDIFVDADETSLTIRVQSSGSLITLIETSNLYGKIKPAETIWYIDEDQLVVNLKKHDPELKWPDIMESRESLTTGVVQILKGTSIYVVGDSTEVNEKVSRELAVGLGYTPLNTSELLEAFAKQTIDSWVIEEGVDSIVEAESAVLASLSSHVRAVVATLGAPYGAAGRVDKWQHLYSGFTVWLSQSDATDENSAKEEARRQIQDESKGYSNAEVVVKHGEWHPNHSLPVAQACLSALKRLILSDKKLPGKKNLYIRLGCRGDWPNIKPPGWDPSAADNISSQT